MIVRDDGDHLLLVRQADHALLAGWLAAAWGAPPWGRSQARDSTIVAGRLHDLAWTPFDEALPRRADGRPYAFFEVARTVTTRLYLRGIDAVEAIDPYAGLLTSLHYSGFFVSHWGWRHAGQSATFEGEDGAALSRFLDHEHIRQRRLRDWLGVDRARDLTLRCDYLWLQLWDRISLDLCMRGFGWSAEYQAAPLGPEARAREVALRVEAEPGGICRLRPYPLQVSPYTARVPATRIPIDDLDDAAAVHQAWLAGGAEGVDVTFLPG